MAEKTKTIIKIGGREYTVKASEPEEYVHKVAIYVNRKMEEVKRVQPSLSTTQVSVLTAINLGDEVIKLKDTITSLQNELAELKKSLKRQSLPVIHDVKRR